MRNRARLKDPSDRLTPKSVQRRPITDSTEVSHRPLKRGGNNWGEKWGIIQFPGEKRRKHSKTKTLHVRQQARDRRHCKEGNISNGYNPLVQDESKGFGKCVLATPRKSNGSFDPSASKADEQRGSQIRCCNEVNRI
jgi:hypothetical protein